MRQWPCAGVLALIALGVGACSSGNAMRVDAQGFTLARPALLTGPDRFVESVSTRADEITLWVRFEHVTGPHTVRVHWIDPYDRVALDSGPVLLNPEGGFRATAGMSSTLPIRHAPAELLPGAWRARLHVDGRRMAVQEFEIENAG